MAYIGDINLTNWDLSTVTTWRGMFVETTITGKVICSETNKALLISNTNLTESNFN